MQRGMSVTIYEGVVMYKGVITKKRVVIMTMLWLLLFVIMIATDTCPLIDTRSELEKFQDTWGDLYDLEGDAE